tara:strand:- start:2246 stop:3220 length:975 start_codon:yes stop_codon:yes gene_type:complete
MRKVKILITGISGYIGNKFLEKFVEGNNEVDIILNFKKKPEDYQKYSKYQITYNSIEKNFYFEGNVDVLVHIASEKYSHKKMWSTNYLGTKNILRWAINSGVKKIIYISSISVYGRGNLGIVSEKSQSKPADIYGQSKYASERLIKKICKKNNIQYYILQPSNVIDYELYSNFPLLNFIRSIKNNQFCFFGEPSKVYVNYVNLEDVVRCIIFMIECNNYSGVYILNEPINLNQLVYEIAKYLDVVKPKRVLPKNIGYYVAILGDLYHYLTKKNISFNSTIFSEMTNQARYDGSLVARCLKFKYRYSIRYTVKQLVMKYSEKKLI